MGVVLLTCENEELLLERALAQLKRQRGDQTDSPTVSLCYNPSTELNLSTLKAAYPQVKVELCYSKEPMALLHTVLAGALQGYPKENAFLWATASTYFIQPPRIQIGEGYNWAALPWKYTTKLRHIKRSVPILLPTPGYIIFNRTSAECALYHLETSSTKFLPTDIYSFDVHDPANKPTVEEVAAYYFSLALYIAEVPCDTVTLRNQIVPGKYLQARTLKKLAQVGNTRNL